MSNAFMRPVLKLGVSLGALATLWSTNSINSLFMLGTNAPFMASNGSCYICRIRVHVSTCM